MYLKKGLIKNSNYRNKEGLSIKGQEKLNAKIIKEALKREN